MRSTVQNKMYKSYLITTTINRYRCAEPSNASITYFLKSYNNEDMM